jgi:hypothetical protein
MAALADLEAGRPLRVLTGLASTGFAGNNWNPMELWASVSRSYNASRGYLGDSSQVLCSIGLLPSTWVGCRGDEMPQFSAFRDVGDSTGASAPGDTRDREP